MARVRTTLRTRGGGVAANPWHTTALPVGITLGAITGYAGYGMVVVELPVTEMTASIVRVRGEFREQGTLTSRRFPVELWRISPSDAWDLQRTFVAILANCDTTKVHEIRLTVEDSRDNTAYVVGTVSFRQGAISDASAVTPTHYLRSDAGADGNAGTSHAAAWASLEQMVTAFNAAGAGSDWVVALETGYYFRPSTTLHNTSGRKLHLVAWKADGSAWNPACDDSRALTTGPHAVVHGWFSAPTASDLAEDGVDATKGRLGTGPWTQHTLQGQGSRYNYTDGTVPDPVPDYTVWQCTGTGVTGITTAAYSPAVSGGDYAAAKTATPLRVSSWSRTVYTGADSCTDTLAGWAETVTQNPAYNAGVWQDGTTDTVYLLLPGGIDPNTRYVWLGDGTGTDNITSRQGLKVDTPNCRVSGVRFRALNNGIRVEDDGDGFIADHCVTDCCIYGILLNGIGATPPQNWLEDVRIHRCLFLDTNTWSSASDPDTDTAAIPWKFVKSHIGARNVLAENGTTDPDLLGYYPGAVADATTPPTVKLGTATEGDGVFIRRYVRYVQVTECTFDGPFNGCGQSIETQWQQAEDRYQGTCVEIANNHFTHIMDNPVEHEGGSMGWYVHDNTYDLCNTCYSLDFNYGPVIYHRERSWRISNIGIRSDGHLTAPARGTTGGVFKWGGSGDPRAAAIVCNCTYWNDQGTLAYRTGIWADSVSGTANQAWWVFNTIARGMGYVFDDTNNTPWQEDYNLFASGDASGRGHRRAGVNYNASGTTGAASIAAYRSGLIFGAPAAYGAFTNRIDGTDYNFVSGGVALIDGELRDPTNGDVRLKVDSAVLASGREVGMLVDRAGTDYTGAAPSRGYEP